ncbi:DegV family protein [Ligilactobacillus equi]|uniref:DegV family protein n=1 Tax=Ligilactobacillus equi TaxID=137357 RepID=UPI002ED054AA
MTNKLKIVTDSSVQLTQEEIEKYDITVIPLSVEINGENHVDGETITRQELVDELRKGNIPKTSQPAMGRFVDTFQKLGDEGYDVLAIMMSDVLSGTYQSACSAAEMVDTNVTVINSKSTDRGLAFQVLAAAKDLQAGKSIDEIKAHCLDIYSRTTIDVYIDNLDCLVAGGRVSKMAGLLTKLINLKVIVRLRDESLDVYMKGRSKKTFLKHAKEVAELHQDNPLDALSLSNVGTDPEFLQKIKDTIYPDVADENYLAELTSPIIMTHTGLNAVGVITLASKPEPENNR